MVVRFDEGTSPIIQGVDDRGGGSGGGGGGYNPAPPSGPPSGGGGQTNMANSTGGVPHWDAWLGQNVFLGFDTKSKRKPGTTDIPIKQHGIRYQTAFEILQGFRTMGPKAYQEFKNKLVAAGFVSKDADPVTVEQAFAGILRDVQTANAMGTMVSPQQVINSYIRKNGFDPKKIGSDKDFDPTAKLAGERFKPSTSTVTSVYDLDPADAEDLLTATLSGVLGRDPSKAEIEDFVDAVKARALADPTTETTRVRRGDLSSQAGPGTQVEVTTQGNKTFSTVSSIDYGFGQTDAERLARRRAEAAPDYASSQAVSTYFPAFLDALASTV